MENNKLIMIPARLGSTRLPGKMLKKIGRYTVIQHVARNALAAEIARVVVATDSPEIQESAVAVGAEVVMTPEALASGTDRIFHGLSQFANRTTYDLVMNLQGDLPNVNPGHLQAAFKMMDDAPEADVGTLVAPLTHPEKKSDPSCVKAVLCHAPDASEAPRAGGGQARHHRALYFSRACVPHNATKLYEHIGIYVYRRPILETFTALPPSPLERCEQLEQLRLLENGLLIYARRVEEAPIAIDTPNDLAHARKFMAPEN